ncbi:glycosyltransferase family 1 protein [Streptomyces actinomycinicus]|uniref:Glycosyltransferase family 1 protein n=1 Tax=Streptomyces actinomycinicus TaxID=1695166 RepID=A0A937EJN0_9ACTN|nr:glycosyltransferase [Streptomyces actinomycinicus]MBL1084382.1 glycosyltransferase family 1 protein [Streptomyces actinomycinicus]
MTAGSRGDVAPYTGLGRRLGLAGHEVTLVTHGRFEALVAGSGLRFHALPVDPLAELQSPRGRALHRSSSGAGKLLRVVELARRVVGRMTEGLLGAARGSDALLLSSSLAPLGHTIAEGLRLPSLGVYLQPLAATREFAPAVLGGGSWGGPVNRLAGHGVSMAVEHVFAGTVPAVRERLGLPPLPAGAARRTRERRYWPVLHGFSPLVVPRPGDWRRGLEVSGYWWPYDTDTQLPERVRQFLDAGSPPVFVGLGSATVPDAGRLSARVVTALRRAGLRGVIQRGWGGLTADGDDMLAIGEVPHALLFPRMAAVVHHAGAGTTAAGLRAGVPAVPVPVQFDAGFWSARLVALGVAPAVVPLRRLTVDALAPALERATRDPACRRRAEALGARIRDEDGAAPVIAVLDRLDG